MMIAIMVMIVIAAPRIRLAVRCIGRRRNNMRGTAVHRRKVINARATNSATRDTAVANVSDTQAANVTNTTEAAHMATTTEARPYGRRHRRSCVHHRHRHRHEVLQWPP
jgi:hypothetical protein